MAKITIQALEVIRQLFDKKDFVIVEGVIYKKIKSTSITINKHKYTTEDLVKLLLNLRKKKKEKIESPIPLSLKELINNNFIVQYDKLYKKCGGTHQRGYKSFIITIDGVSYFTYAHRIIYYLHTGTWDDNRVINHIDSNKSNNRIENLELVTQFENIIYSLKNGEAKYKPSMISNTLKEYYNLNDAAWEIFKKELYDGYRKRVFKDCSSDDYKYGLCRDFETPEEYNENEAKYIEKYNMYARNRIKSQNDIKS